MKKRVFLVSLLIILGTNTPLNGLSRISATNAASSVIKSQSNPAVYYLYNGKRYAFPNEKVYFSWYSDFSQVSTITDGELAAIPLAGNVTYRPGVKMVKIATDPKVYAVASNGTLRWIASEELAAGFYGENWNKMIDDVADTFFINYHVGTQIISINDYNPVGEISANSFFVPFALSTPSQQSQPPITSNIPSPPSTPPVIQPPSQPPIQSTPLGVVAEYLTCLSPAEKNQIDADFHLQSKYPPATTWGDASYVCDFSSNLPSELKIYNTLRFLKNINFDRPLPFTQGQTIYNFLRLQTISPEIRLASSGRMNIRLHSDCSMFSSGGNNVAAYTQDKNLTPTFNVDLSGLLSRIYPAQNSPSCENAGLAMDSPLMLQGRYSNPMSSAELVVHEAYHAVLYALHDAPNGADKTIDQMGAWAAQFYFNAWVALYSTNIDSNTKDIARWSAADILKSRFSEQKCPSDQILRNVVNQITPSTCP